MNLNARFDRRAAIVALPILAGALTSTARAADGRPITIIVAYPPGGASDATARLLARRLSESLGRAVVVDNRAGADGIIAMQALARAPADGTTLGFAAVSPLALTPHVRPLPFDLKAVVPLAPVMYSPGVLIATSSAKVKDFAEFVRRAKDAPGSVRAGVSGTVSVATLVFEQLQKQVAMELTIVPYKGGGQLLTDALAGHFEVLYMNADPTVLQSVVQGKLTALAVAAPARIAALKDIPTLTELGYPLANRESVFGLFVPAGLPDALADQLGNAIHAVLAEAEFKAKLAEMGNSVFPGSRQDFQDRIDKESRLNAQIIRAANLVGR